MTDFEPTLEPTLEPKAHFDLELQDQEDAPSEAALRVRARLDAQFGESTDETASDASASNPESPEAPLDNVHELPLIHHIETPSLTNSPGCTPTAPWRMRTVRVDAWSVPASANWTRTRRTVRKVNRSEKKADWALPF